ncbi:MAG: PQQ-binding-like beta-propeller repeat protein [Planctomycetota bacterium]
MIALSIAVFFNRSWGEDWSQYRGPLGDGKSAEAIGDLTPTKSELSVTWKTPTPLGFSSFSVANGRAFTIIAKESDGETKEWVLAVDADSGRELWSVPLGASEYGHDGGNAGAPNNRGGDGPRSTPSTDGQHVYVYDSHLLLACFDAASGQPVWERQIVSEFDGRNIKWFNATSPLMDDKCIYVGGGGPGQSFLAFDKLTGDIVWKTGDEQITHATPHLTVIEGTKQVIFFVQSGLVSLDASTGNELWRTSFPFSVSTAASPVSEGNLVYCSAGYGVGAGLFRVNGGSEPDEVWFKANELMNHWSTPVVHEGHLYGMFEFKKYGRAPLQCVDLATGEIKWLERGFGPGNCILAGDKLIALSDAGEVVIVEARSDQYNELARQKVVDGKCWSTPAYSDGKIFVRSTVEGACIQLD